MDAEFFVTKPNLKTPTKLLRTGRLQWDAEVTSWQAYWFALSAKREKLDDPIDAFWQRIGIACITALCHIASTDEKTPDDLAAINNIALPDETLDWLDAAPPMPGGEFLNQDMLQTLWAKLLKYCAEEASKFGSIAKFLEAQSPKWIHVGRIFFHLAENKMDQAHPFAFLATYAVGLNDKGQPRHLPLANALKFYAKQHDKAALVRLLDPLVKASGKLPWVQSMLDKKTIYQPRPWTPAKAYNFLKSVPILEESGVGIRLPNWWKKRSKPQIKATFDMENKSRLGADALINIDLKVAIGDNECSPSELRELLENASDGLVLFKGQWVEIDKEKLQQALDYWEVAAAQAQDGNMSFVQGLRLLAGLPRDGANVDADEEIRAWSHAEPGPTFQTLLNSARQEVHADIPDLNATLRPYQAQGVEWLSFLGKIGLGGCLADDMGLGKTLQILALLLKDKSEHASLLIAPASLLRNWQAEAAKFAPSLKLLLLHGLNKKELETYATHVHQAFDGYDLVLTSYAGCVKAEWLQKYPWQRVIADEAQAIKNAQTKQSKAVRSLKQGAHIALTGTPIENSLTDLWALFDFLNPGLLGSAKSFNTLTKRLEAQETRFAPLRRLTQPYILRRMKTDKSVIDCLPDKTEMPLYCHLTKEQAKIYVNITEKLKSTLQTFSTDPESLKKRRMVVLQSIMLLKQVCNHPAQAVGDDNYAPEKSGKFKALAEVCDTIAARQEKVLIFTQFREIIPPLANFLTDIFGQKGLVMHGGIPVKARQGIVDEFQAMDGPPFLLLTLKVGGTGLTLTAANHVIHFDRWWNPAVEDQATDRAFRIGQKKNVLVHKCITRGTLEEKIAATIMDKRDLAAEILGERSEMNLASLSDTEIYNLVRLDASQIGE